MTGGQRAHQRRDQDRDQIRAAIDRLLGGTPARSDGALTVVALAAEAGVKRHLLTHRHTDLKDEFYARVRAQNKIPDSERQLREELATTRHKLTEARDEIRGLRESVEAFARITNVLATENDGLARRCAHPTLVALRPEPPAMTSRNDTEQHAPS